MSNDTTVAGLFEMAIAAEETAEALYRALAARFARYPAVAGFWQAYADEEAGHARWLERLRDSLSQEELAMPTDPLMLDGARRMRGFSLAEALRGIRNLEDAYQLATELENSETNMVFEFLITHFATDPEAQSFLQFQLRDHVARLANEFPTRYRGVVVRRNTPARDHPGDLPPPTRRGDGPLEPRAEVSRTFGRWHVRDDDLVGLTPTKARDLMVQCFFVAQKDTFAQAKERLGRPASDPDIHASVVAAVRLAFQQCGEDFDRPTQAGLVKVVEILGSKARSWGTPRDIIEHHQREIQRVLDRL